jgi:transketolase
MHDTAFYAREHAAGNRRMADVLRTLALDAVDAAGSGQAAVPMAMADVATSLWCRTLRFDATDPRWPDRDRFLVSAEGGELLHYGLLHLTGHAGMTLDDLRRYRQVDSPAAGHAEYGDHPGIEATTGPAGQGLATAVGLALAERMMAARFGRSLVDHRTWVMVSGGDLMQGVSHEAIELAGCLRLEKLTVLWNDHDTGSNGDGGPNGVDVLKRFAASGWVTKRINGHDSSEISTALALAARSKKPTLIACRTGPALPLAEARGLLGWRHPPFDLPSDLVSSWRGAGARGTGARRAWLKRLANHPLRAEFERMIAGRLPEAWHKIIATLKTEFMETRTVAATRHSSRQVFELLMTALPELTGGTADQLHATGGVPDGVTAVGPAAYAGRYVHYGVRDHAMAACMNGLALHGGLLPFASTRLVCTDALRPALRLTAQMRQRVIYLLTHDSIGLGQDGAAYQPVEQLASLRATPGLFVLRPADSIETVECWELAIRRSDGPTLLVLSHQDVPLLRTDAAENRCARGGYVLAEADGPRAATLIASGSEVSIALEARQILAREGIPAAVVSLPSWELFAAQDEDLQAQVLGAALRVGVEAACGFGWERWLGPDGIFIGMSGYGASAPCDTLYRHFGITPEAIAMAVRKRLPQAPSTEGS